MTDLYGDGRKEIVVPTFVRYVEALDAAEGQHAEGAWPASFGGTSHAGAVLWDADADGVRDVVVTTYDAELLFFRDDGSRIQRKLSVPKLRVRKDWFKGLDDTTAGIDRDHLTVQEGQLADYDFDYREAEHAQLHDYDNADVKQQLDPNIHGRAPPPPKVHRAPGQPQYDEHVRAPSGGGGGGGSGSAAAGSGAMGSIGETELDDRLADLKAREELAKRAVDEALEAVEATDHPDMETLVFEAATDELSADPDAGKRGVDAAMADASAALEMARKGDKDGARERTKKAALETLEAASHTLEDLADTERTLAQGQQQQQQQQPGAEGDAQDLPAGWIAHVDPATGRTYYERPDGSTQWEKPAAAGSSLRRLLQEGAGEDDDDVGFDLSVEAKAVLSYEGEDDDDDDDDEGEEAEDYSFLNAAHDYYVHRKSALFDYSESDFPGGDHSSQQHWEQYVYVDAHVLCTPVVADVDGDGREELVMSVSYFFDKDTYASPAKRAELGEGVDPAYYVAGGVVVYSLDAQFMAGVPDSMPGYPKWSAHLDLTTDLVQYRAYIYSSPTVADLDGDGEMEIIVGTSVGFVYVLSSADGSAKPNWPLQMGEIQGQVAVGDVNGDGYLEVVAVDARGTVAVFDWRANEVWERHLGALISQGATLGDADGDGRIEVVVGTAAGHVHVLDGATGDSKPNFPFRTFGKIMSPVLMVKLDDRPEVAQQHLVVPSWDGYVYVIDGKEGCADTVDLGENTYAMPLADDLDNNGRMDIVIATMNGAVYALETSSAYDPLKAWTALAHGANGFSPGLGHAGIAATPASRRPRDLTGANFSFEFEIVDNRAAAAGHAPESAPQGPYRVRAALHTAGPGAVALTATFDAPGKYVVMLPMPKERGHGAIVLQMTDVRGLIFTDSFSVSFHTRAHRLYKWVVLLPLTVAVALLLAGSAPNVEKAVLPGGGLPSARGGAHAD